MTGFTSLESSLKTGQKFVDIVVDGQNWPAHVLTSFFPDPLLERPL